MENIEILKLKDRHRIIKEHNFNTMAEVEAYRKAIDDYRSKQLTLTDVSQQRELLYALADELDVATGKPTPPSMKTLVINKILGI